MEIISERHRVEEVYYEMSFISIEFPDGGYSFGCDEKGNIFFDKLTDCAKENYQYCLNHVGDIYNKPTIEKLINRYTENAKGICECGKEIELYDEYMGVCECPYCKRWHNLFGDELNPPAMWEENEEEDF